MKAKDLHGGFGVGVVSWLKAQLMQSQVGEEGANNGFEVTQAQPVVSEHALHLVKLGQMRRVQRLVAEDSIDAEVALRRKLLLQGSKTKKVHQGKN